MFAKFFKKLSSQGEVVRLLSGGLLSLFIKVAAAGLSLAMFAAVARVTSTEDFGTFGFGFSLATLLGVAGSFGQRMFALKEGSVAHAEGDTTGLAVLGVTGGLIVITGTLAFALAMLIVTWLGWFDFDSRLMLPVTLVAIALALAEYLTHLFRSFRSVTFSLVPRDIVWRLAMLAISGLAALTGNMSGATALSWTGLSLLVIVVVQYLATPETRLSLKPDTLRQMRPLDSLRGARYLWGTSLIQTVGGPVLAPVLLGLVLSPSDVGPFFAAMRIALVMDLFTMAAGMVVGPAVARRIRSGELAPLQRLLTQSAVGVSAATGISLLAIVFFGDRFLAWMNPDFASAYKALLILGAAYLVSVMTGPVPTIMELSGLEGRLLRRLLWANGITFAAFWPMILFFGMEGAALCVAGLRIFLHVSLLFPVRRALGVDPSVLSLRGRRHRV